jgi:hypothetical protein
MTGVENQWAHADLCHRSWEFVPQLLVRSYNNVTVDGIILRFERSRRQKMKHVEPELSKPYETDRHVDPGRLFAGNHVDHGWQESIPRIVDNPSKMDK